MNQATELKQPLPIVLGITGASGAIYAAQTLKWLLLAGRRVHLIVSPDGATVVRQELGFGERFEQASVERFLRTADHFLAGDEFMLPERQSSGGISNSQHNEVLKSPVLDKGNDQAATQPPDGSQWEHLRKALAEGRLQIHPPDDYFAPIASGSYRTAAMVVCPCSGSTLSTIAHAAGRNLIHRAAEVHLKERRKLILVPRETPLSGLQIHNMASLSSAGAVILPASPGWYHGVRRLQDLVDFVASRILDQLDVPHQHIRRWGDSDTQARG